MILVVVVECYVVLIHQTLTRRTCSVTHASQTVPPLLHGGIDGHTFLRLLGASPNPPRTGRHNFTVEL